MRCCLALLALAGCDAVESRPASWSYVHAAIIAPSCATIGCHSQISSTKGLDLSTISHGYVALTGRTCGAPPHAEDSPGNFVVPFDHARSRLWLLLLGQGDTLVPAVAPPVMPPDEPLPRAEIELVVQWIDRGAPCD